MKPIVKLVRAVTLKPGDEYFTFKGGYRRRVEKTTPRKTKTKGMGVLLDTFLLEDRRPGKVCYGANARVYKIVGWRCKVDGRYLNGWQRQQIAGSGFMRAIEAMAVMSNPLKPRHCAEPLHVRQQKEINELKAALQSAIDVNAKHVASLLSMQEECDLKAHAIDELNAALEEKARGNAALNATICGLRHKLTKANNVAAEQYNLNTRLHGVVEDITQRLEDFRDGE